MNYNNRLNIMIGINYFRGLNYPDNFIAGLFGNFQTETANTFDPKQVQLSYLANKKPAYGIQSCDDYVARVDAGTWKDPQGRTFDTDRIGFGFAQWTSAGRKTGFHNYCLSKGASVGDLMTQYEWIHKEIHSTGYANVRKALYDNKSVEDCARVICTDYERPASMQKDEATKEAAIQKRINYALEFYKEFFNTESTREQYIEEVATYAAKYAPGVGIKIISPTIAQFCKESAFGTSELATNANNYVGIKFKLRKDGTKRCPSASDVAYAKVGSEQNPDGTYVSSAMQWCMFDSLESCVKGYYEFLSSSSTYDGLKGITDVEDFCNIIKAYATSITYAESLLEYIDKYNLTQYDALVEDKRDDKKEEIKEEIKMGFTNSPLADFIQISPNKDVNRKYPIDTIIIHCYVGQVSVERMGSGWQKTTANASANYGIGTDGRIGLYVDEKDRAWTTGGKYTVNGWTGSKYDHRAITIECACDKTTPYAINDAVMKSLIKLCADICKRNGIKELKWKGDKNLIGNAAEQNLVVHRWFAAKSCPGDYIYSRLGMIASEVNALLGASTSTPAATPSTTIKTDTVEHYTVVKGDTLSKIASKYGVTVDAIVAATNADSSIKKKITNVNVISVGQIIAIPTTKTVAAPVVKKHVVVKGDTLSKIGKTYGVAWTDIAKANDIKFPYILKIGRELIIP